MNEPFRPQKPQSDNALKINGAMPPEFAAKLAAAASPTTEPTLDEQINSIPKSTPLNTSNHVVETSSLKDLIEQLKEKTTNNYEKILLPSLGKFYDGKNGPADGYLHLRPMTGAEEQFLATGRLVKDGQAIDMIFKNCILEKYPTEKLLSVDRNYILIRLRGISYGPIYSVEVSCPACDHKFENDINLNLDVEECPNNFGVDNLEDKLPDSGLKFSYRLQNGQDELDVNRYKEKGKKSNVDDTLTHRTALLLNELGGFYNKHEIKLILNSLKVNDLAHIRNCLNDPPFGVNTQIDMVCENCLHEFSLDLPMTADFFFPRRKKEELKDQA